MYKGKEGIHWKMARDVATTEKQAELLKDQGNLYFKKEKLGAAIEAYTQAITLCPDVPVFWTNRALCHRKRNEWDRVESDCKRALQLDNSSTKAHYWLGLALLQNKQYKEAVKQLEKALELGRGGSRGDLVEEIWQELAKARHTVWEQEALVRQRQQRELKECCARLLKQEYEKKVRELKVAAEGNAGGREGVIHIDDDEVISAISSAYFPTEKTESYLTADQRQKNELSRLSETYQEHLHTLDEVFDKASAPDRPGEVLDHLCCQISMDIFRDPVITPSGVTYERAVLMEHLRKVGKFDPLTRAPLLPEQLVPNLAMKDAVQTYLSEHGWAYKTY